MSRSEPKLTLIGAWRCTPAIPDRWHSLQSSIWRQAAPAYGWALRSSVTCRWRAVPASVSG